MTRSARVLLGSLCLLQLATGINWSMYFAFAGLYFRDKFGLSLATISLLVSSAFLTYCLTQFAMSLLLDVGVRVVGERWMLLRSPVLYGLGMAILTFGTSPVAVVIGGSVAGLGAATSPLMLAAMSDRASKRHSGLVASLLSASYLVGQLAALGVGWILVSGGNADAAFVSTCGMWLVVTVALYFTLRIEPLPHQSSRPLVAPILRKIMSSFGEMRRLLADPRTRAMKALIFLAGVAPVLAGIYIPLYFITLVDDPRLSAGYISASTAIGYLLGGALTPALGMFADRRQNAGRLLLVVLLVVTLVVVLISRVRDPLLVSILTVTFTIGAQWLNTLQSAILLLEVSNESPTTFFAVNQLPFYAGLPVGLAFGIAAVGATGSVESALLVVAGMFALAALIWARHLQGKGDGPSIPSPLSPTRGERGRT